MDCIAELSAQLSPPTVASKMLHLMKVQLQIEVAKMSSTITSNPVDKNSPVQAMPMQSPEVGPSLMETVQDVSDVFKYYFSVKA
jgi:hypothetical protein